MQGVGHGCARGTHWYVWHPNLGDTSVYRRDGQRADGVHLYVFTDETLVHGLAEREREKVPA